MYIYIYIYVYVCRQVGRYVCICRPCLLDGGYSFGRFEGPGRRPGWGSLSGPKRPQSIMAFGTTPL